jgi:ribosome maturation factor RimP
LFAVLDEEVMMGRTEEIRELAEPIVVTAGLELWDVEVAAGLVRVLVERPAGIDHDALTVAARALSSALDEHDQLVPAGRYDLEVSSPGIERTLRTPDQYQRYVGSDVSVKVARAVDGSRRLLGTLAEAGAAGITLVPRDLPERRLAIEYDDIQRCHIVAVWGPTTAPGRPTPKDRARSRAGATRESAVADARVGTGSAPEPKDA